MTFSGTHVFHNYLVGPVRKNQAFVLSVFSLFLVLETKQVGVKDQRFFSDIAQLFIRGLSLFY